MWIRIGRSRLDPAKLDQDSTLVGDLAEAYRQLPGFQSWVLTTDRATGRLIHVSTSAACNAALAAAQSRGRARRAVDLLGCCLTGTWTILESRTKHYLAGRVHSSLFPNLL